MCKEYLVFVLDCTLELFWKNEKIVLQQKDNKPQKILALLFEKARIFFKKVIFQFWANWWYAEVF